MQPRRLTDLNSLERKTVYDILSDIDELGRCSKPRGQLIRELDYFSCIIDGPWSWYNARRYNMDYFKAEFQWYLEGNPFDDRILKHAKMWEKIRQPGGEIFSNYGQYWFHNQKGFFWSLRALREDPDTRQAYIAMNNFHHAFDGNKDFVCTKGIQFRIIEGRVFMHVSMRSSDAIFGLGTDLPCFWFLWYMMADALRLPTGEFVFSADSVHFYERHFEMVAQILHDGPYAQQYIYVPSLDDHMDLINGNYKSTFGQWLREVKL